MARFLLVHGSWHGAWCWDHVVQNLHKSGHVVRAIDLPGHGDNARNPEDVTLAHYTAAIQAEVSEMGGPVILVGHSMGGLAISVASDGIAGEISKLVYVAGIVPGRSDSLIDLTERHIPTPRLLDTSVEIEGLVGTVKPDYAHGLFYSDCSPEVSERSAARLGPEPLMPLLTPASVSEAGFGSIPKLYVECTQDNTIPLGAQRAMIRDARISNVISLASGHSPFLSMPGQLTEILSSLEEAAAA